MSEINKNKSKSVKKEKPIHKSDVLLRIANQLENIASDTNKSTDVTKLVKQLKAIVLRIYKYIDEQSKNNIVINNSNIHVIHNEIHNEIHKEDQKKNDSLDSADIIKNPKSLYSISSQFHLYYNANTSKVIIVNHKTAEYKFGKYEGEFKNGIMDGKGKMTYKNKFEYQGDWKDGKREGKGKYVNTSSKDMYEGDFKCDKAEGKGVAIYNNGDKYEGDYKDWNKEGRGIYYYNNGDKYEGEFKNDLSEGLGVYSYKNGNKYIGEFKSGVPEGYGIYYYSSGKKNGDRYEGKIKN